MGYVSNADIELRLGTAVAVQLTDDAGAGVINAALLDEARSGAEGEVNSYLARRFQTPIDVGAHAEVAGLLVSVTLDLVEYRLHARRPPIPPSVIQRHRSALDWLGRVASGAVSLPSAIPIASSKSSGLVSGSTGEPVAFSRDDLEGL